MTEPRPGDLARLIAPTGLFDAIVVVVAFKAAPPEFSGDVWSRVAWRALISPHVGPTDASLDYFRKTTRPLSAVERLALLADPDVARAVEQAQTGF